MRAKLFSTRDTWHTLASVDEDAHKGLCRSGYFCFANELHNNGSSSKGIIQWSSPTSQLLEVSLLIIYVYHNPIWQQKYITEYGAGIMVMATDTFPHYCYNLRSTVRVESLF